MSKKAYSLSVIVPVYNEEKYIKECVQSIIKQDYIDLEIILVDDESSDQSGVLCDLLAEEYNFVNVLHVPHGGITKARLSGVEAAKSDKITFVDADDWIEEDAYRDIAFEENCDIVITGICSYLDSEHYTMHFPYFAEGIYNKEEIIKEIVPIMLWNPRHRLWAVDPSLCTKIFRKSMILEQLKKASKVGSNYGEDSMVIFPMMFQAKGIQIKKKIYYYHRQRKTNTVPDYIEDENFIPKLYKVYEYLKNEFQNLQYWKIMKEQLDCFFINAIELKKRCYKYPILEFAAFFPIDKIRQGSKVVLYGAGNVGKQYWDQNAQYHFCNIISWVDTKCKGHQINNITIEGPEIIKGLFFDYVVIAVDDDYVAQEIALVLKKVGVAEEKIIWHSTRVYQKKL